MSKPLPKGIFVGQTWRGGGQFGHGPSIKITDIDLTTGVVTTTYLDTSSQGQTYRTTLSRLIELYELISNP